MNFIKGHAIWIYEPDICLLNSIQDYNARSDIRIKYLFVYAGSIDSNIHFQNRCLDFYAISNSDFMLYPIIDGLNENLEELTSAAKAKLASAIATQYNQDKRVAGIHINIEPFRNSSVEFYKLLRQEIRKPLSVSLYNWNDRILEICDIPVLMAYDLGSNPDEFAKLANIRISSFVSNARSQGTHYMIGLPFIATHREFEYRIHKVDNHCEYQGFTMDQYLSQGLKVIEELKHDELFIGIAIWAGLNRPVGTPSEPYHWHPFEISQKNWEMLVTWSAHPK